MKYYNFGIKSPLEESTVKDYEITSAGNSMENYKKLFDEHSAFEISFSAAAAEDGPKYNAGDLYTFTDDGVEVILPNRSKNGNYLYNPAKRMTRVLYSYEVTVSKIDEESRIVYVQTTRVTDRETVLSKITSVLNSQRKEYDRVFKEASRKVDDLFRNTYKKEVSAMSERTANSLRHGLVNEYLMEGLKESNIELIGVRAVVKKVDKRFMMLDIMGLGIPAKLSAYNWSYRTAAPLYRHASVGDVIDVYIYDFCNTSKEAKPDEMAFFQATRLPLVTNCWETIPYNTQDIIRCKCIDIKDHNWFGKLAGTEIEMYCEMPKDRAFEVVIGNEYLCAITTLNKSLRNMKAKCIRPVGRQEAV